jgi:hypothetical protein
MYLDSMCIYTKAESINLGQYKKQNGVVDLSQKKTMSMVTLSELESGLDKTKCISTCFKQISVNLTTLVSIQ